MSRFCPYCGSKLIDASGFCQNCRAPVTAEFSTPTQKNINDIRFNRPLPQGITVTPDAGYRWTAERSVWKCMPFFKILHIVCAVLTVLICILILAIEGSQSVSTALLYCLIAIAGMGVIDLLLCLFYGARRAFRFKVMYTIGHNDIAVVELEAESENIFVLFIQLMAGIVSARDISY